MKRINKDHNNKQSNNKKMKIINKSNQLIVRMNNKTKIPDRKNRSCDFTIL